MSGILGGDCVVSKGGAAAILGGDADGGCGCGGTDYKGGTILGGAAGGDTAIFIKPTILTVVIIIIVAFLIYKMYGPPSRPSLTPAASPPAVTQAQLDQAVLSAQAALDAAVAAGEPQALIDSLQAALLAAQQAAAAGPATAFRARLRIHKAGLAPARRSYRV